MINPNELKQKRAKLINDAQVILDKAQAEKRDLAPEERLSLDKMHADAKLYGEDIERIERQNAMEMKNAPSHVPAVAVEDRKTEKRSAFFKYLREGRALLSREERALVEDTTGAYMVPEDLEVQIYRGLPQLNVIRQLATVRPTTRDKVARRSITEVSVGWGKLETGSLITESTLVPSKDYIYVEDLAGLTKVGRDELQDSDDILSGIIANSFSVAIANAEAKAFVIGTGHTYQQPDGVTLDATIISTYTDLATPDTVVPDDVIGIEYALPAQYKNGASFMWHPTTEGVLRKVKATANYLWIPNIVGAPTKMFDGYPVYNSSDMIVPASDNTDRSIVGLFGNWRLGYTIVDRLGVTVQRLDELYAESGLVGFLVYFRVGGGVVRADAFRALDNNT
jgi:HK97 family phage major capsid protein